MLKSLSAKIVLAAAVFLMILGVSYAGTNLDKEIALARSAAPAAISANATINNTELRTELPVVSTGVISPRQYHALQGLQAKNTPLVTI